MQVQSQYLDYSNDRSFQGVNRLSVLTCEDNAIRKRYVEYFLPKVKIKFSQKDT